MSREPWLHPLIDEKAREYYLKTVPHLPAPLNVFSRLLKSPTVRKLSIALEDAVLPGDLMHLVMRKLYIHEELIRARDDGFEQLVVIGSGFDFAGIRWAMWGGQSFELDRPRTHALKKKINRVTNFNPPTLWYLPTGKNDSDFDKLLSDHPFFDPDKSTLFLAEGFLDYLDEHEVHRVFESISNTSSQLRRFVFTLFDFDAMDPLHARIIRESVAAVGEKLGYNIGRNNVETLLDRHKFRISNIVDTQKMCREKLDPLGITNPLFTDFYIVRSDCLSEPYQIKKEKNLITPQRNGLFEWDLGSTVKTS